MFIADIANRVFYGAMGRGIPSEEKDDLVQEAFFVFMDLVSKKPAKIDLRDFVYEPVYRKLIEINRKHAKRVRKEHLWGEEVYFDIADIVEKY